MLKRWLALLIAAVLLLSVFPSGALAEDNPEESSTLTLTPLSLDEEEDLSDDWEDDWEDDWDSPVTVTVSYYLLDDSPLSYGEVGDIRVRLIEEYGPNTYEVVLNETNGRSAQVSVVPGDYTVALYDEVAGYYVYSPYIDEWTTYYLDGDSSYLSLGLSFMSAPALTVSLDFTDDSLLTSAQVGGIAVRACDIETYQNYPGTLTHDNGRRVQLDVPAGEYYLYLTADKTSGYAPLFTGLENGMYVSVDESGATVSGTISYVEDLAVIDVALTFLEDSQFSGSEIGDILCIVGNEAGEIGSVLLTEENGRKGQIELPSGGYTVYFSGYEKEGYLSGLEYGEWVEIALQETFEVRRDVSYIEDKIFVDVSLDFAEDSAFSGSEVGDITVVVQQTHDSSVRYTALLTEENGRHVRMEIPSGMYDLTLADYEIEGYVSGLENRGGWFELAPGEEYIFEATASYIEDKVNLVVDLSFDLASGMYTWLIDDITVTAEDVWEGTTYTALLTDGNGRRTELTVPSGTYNITFSGYEAEGYYAYSSGELWWESFEAGQTYTIDASVRYEPKPATLDISLNFTEDSVFSGYDIGEITVVAQNTQNGKRYTAVLDEYNEYHVWMEVAPGYFDIYFKGYEREGYVCGLENPGQIYAHSGDAIYQRSYDVNYVKDISDVSISVVFPEGNPFTSEDFGDITLTIGSWTDDTLRQTVTLTEENGRKAQFTLPSGRYYALLSGHEVEGYEAYYYEDFDIEPKPSTEIILQITHTSFEETAGYFNISLTFDEQSELKGSEIGDITATLVDCHSGARFTALLTEENGRHAKVAVPDFCEYKLELSGSAPEGYQIIYTGSDYTQWIYAGETESFNVIADVAIATSSLTVKVQLAEGSDTSLLNGQDDFHFYSYSGFEWSTIDSVYYDGSPEFIYVMGDLPVIDVFVLHYYVGNDRVSVQSITCSEPILYESEGHMEFPLPADTHCEVVITLETKALNNDVTVIGNFAEDSTLQAEDLPDGMVVTMDTHPYNKFGWVGPSNNWTYTFTDLDLNYYSLNIEPFAVEGYQCEALWTDADGNSLWGIDASESGPQTVYVTLKYTPVVRYLGADVSFAEDSALSYDTVGSIYLGVRDGDRYRTYEVNAELGWYCTIPLYTTNFSISILGAERDGYDHTVWADTSDMAIRDWAPDEWRYYSCELNYWEQPKKEPGKLIVNVENADGADYVELLDSAGRPMAKAQLNNDRCVFSLDAEGDYILRLRKTYYDTIFASQSLHFVPSEGAEVTLVGPQFNGIGFQLFLHFDSMSELGPEDFPDGIQVRFTNAATGEISTFLLNAENLWSLQPSLPAGVYWVEQLNADAEGYFRQTYHSYKYIGYDYGGASLRDSTPTRSNAQNAGEYANTLTDTVATDGKFFYIKALHDYSRNIIQIKNTYTSPKQGALTITNDHTFAEFGGDILEKEPRTGLEAEAYTYTLEYGEESTTFSLAPGQSRTFQNIPVGTPYTVTETPPEDAAWNTPTTTYTGVIETVVEEPDKDESDTSSGEKVHMEHRYYYVFDGNCPFVLEKTDSITGEPLAGAVFGIYGDEECTVLIDTITSGEDGRCSYNFSKARSYYIKEITAPGDLYQLSEDVLVVEVTQSWNTETRTTEDGSEVTVIAGTLEASVDTLEERENGHYLWPSERKTMEVSVEKRFEEDEDQNRPESIPVTLFRDGTMVETATLSAENEWTYAWTVPMGFSYTVDETEVPRGYEKTIVQMDNHFIITNTGIASPATGDNTLLWFWMGLAVIGLLGSVALVATLRKREN